MDSLQDTKQRAVALYYKLRLQGLSHSLALAAALDLALNAHKEPVVAPKRKKASQTG